MTTQKSGERWKKPMGQSLFDVSGRKVIVTGGTRGLGLGMAEGFLQAGCKVAIVGTSDKVFAVAEEECNKGYDCVGIKGDLSKREEVYRIFNECVEKLGGDLDVLVTSHGIQRRHSAEEFPLNEWDDVISVNLSSIFVLCQEAGKIMLKKGYGKIINVASMNSFFGGQTIPAYAAAKGGVAQLTKELSNDWAGRGINVNAIAPGFLVTNQNRALLFNEDGTPTARSAKILNGTPTHRFVDSEELIGGTFFLCDDKAASAVTGVVLPIDAGFAAYSGV